MSVRSTKEDYADSDIIGLVFLISVTCLIWIRPGLPYGQLPTAVTDVKFNIYVLENGFRWLSRETSLWNPSFFWPNKGMAGLSDLHLGSLFLYSIPRFMGVGRFHSMQIWMISGVILSSCSSYVVARLLKFGVFSSCVCALVYASSLPIAAQVGHAQLLQRWAAPWALLCVLPFPSIAWTRIDRFLVFVIATCVQYLCNPGLAIGLIAVSGIILVSGRLMQLRLKPVGGKVKHTYTAFLFLSSIILFLASAYVSLRYFQVKSEYGLSRSSGEIWDYSPVLKSLLISDYSKYWKLISYQIFVDGGRFEMNLFVGVVVCFLFVVGFGNPLIFSKKVGFVLLASIVITFLLIVRFGDSSMYIVLSRVPGLDSMRAPARFWLIVLLPIGLISAQGMEFVLRNRVRHIASSFVLALIVLECLFINTNSISKHDFEYSVEKLQILVQEKISESGRGGIESFVVVESPNFGNFVDTDAMLVSQELGLPTLNGYSGFTPSGYQGINTCDDLDRIFGSIQKSNPKMNMSKIAVIGIDCA